MAGLLDLIERRRAAEQKSAAQSGGALSKTPGAPPSYDEVTTPAPAMTNEEAGLAAAGNAGLNFGAGVQQTVSMTKNALAAAADAVQQPKFGQTMRASAQGNDAEAARILQHSDAPQSIADVNDPGQFVDYLTAGVARNAPQIGAMVAGRGMFGKAGVPAAAVTMNVGQVYGEANNEIDAMVKAGTVDAAREQVLREQVLQKSGIAGALMGALDTIGFKAMFPGAATMVARSLPKAVLTSIATEGVTEATQEYIGLVANKLALEKPEVFGLTDEDKIRLADAGILGAGVGGAFGLPGAVAGAAGDIGRGLQDLGESAVRGAQSLVPSTQGPVPGIGTNVPEIGTEEGGFDAMLRPHFDKFMAGFQGAAETPNAEALYGQFKQAVQDRAPNADFAADPESLGRVAGEVASTADQWLGKAVETTSDAAQGFQAGVANDTNVAGGKAFEAGRTAGDVVRTASDLVRDHVAPMMKAGAKMTKDAWTKAAEAARASQKTEGQTIDGEAVAAAEPALQALLPDNPSAKRSAVTSPDAQIAQRTLQDYGVSADTARVMARKLDPTLRDVKALDAFFARPDTIAAFQSMGVQAELVGRQIMLDLQAYGQDTENEAFTPGLAPADELVNAPPPDTTEPVLADEAVPDEYNDTGVTVQDQAAIADPAAQRRETFKKMLLSPAQKDKTSQPKGTQWVLLNKTVKDPATGEVLEQGTTQHRVNMMNVARSQAGNRPAAGQSTVERNDQNFAEGMGELFDPWTDTDEQGRTVEYRAQPARQNTQDNVVTAVPRENLDGWLRDESVIGYDQGKPRTLADMKQGQEPFDRIGSAMQRLAKADAKIDEASTPRDRQFWRNKREHELRKIGKQALAPLNKLARLEENNLRAIVDDALEYVQRAEAPVQVDEAWDELQLDPNPEALAAFGAQLESDNLLTALRALPTEVLDIAGPLLTRKLNEFITDRFEMTKKPEIIPGQQEVTDAFGDRLDERGEQVPVTEDLAGDNVNPAAATDAELRSNSIAERERKSVVTSRREAAAAPEVAAASTKKSRAGPSGPAVDLTTPAGQAAARAEIEAIAGKTLKVKFGTTNEYDWQGHVVTLAVTPNGGLGTASHEALHAVFKSIVPDDKRELYAGLNTLHVKQQLRTLLKDSPEALADAFRDAEELAAYAFQFWRHGQLTLAPTAQNFFMKLVDMIGEVSRWLRMQPSAEELFQRIADGYYQDGGPSAVEIAIANRSQPVIRQVISSSAQGILHVWDKYLKATDDALRNTGIGELAEISREFYSQVGEQTKRRGLAQELHTMNALWMNRLSKIVGSNPNAAMQTLQSMAAGDETSDQAKMFRAYLNQIHAYMRDAGVDVGFLKNYLPLQWSGDKIRQDRDAFIAMLSKYDAQIKALGADLTPEKIADMMQDRNLKNAIPTGDIYDMKTGAPLAHHLEDRVFAFLSNADRAPFVEDNLIGTFGQYVKQAIKNAEWVRRFGAESQKFEKLKADAVARGATPEQMALVDDAKDAIFGAKYNRMNPTLRRALGGLQAYQNIRVLGLALFSSVADPLAIGVRTGDFKEAWGAFKFAVANIVKTQDSDLKTLSEDIGAINETGVMDSISSLYGGFEVEGNMKKANDLLFKLNGLDGLTRALRVYATGAGLRFIEKQARAPLSLTGGEIQEPAAVKVVADKLGIKRPARATEEPSTRALAELGLAREDVRFMPDGTMAIRGTQFAALGMSHAEATKAALKMQSALNRFVDESVLRPNAMERPNWGNDPRFALLFHLKSFIFSFHKVVSKKVRHELEHGNYDAVPAAAAFIPIMAASGMVRDMIKFAGDIPADRDFLYYLGVGVNRSGFLGPGTLPSEALTDLKRGTGGVLGPSAGQALEAVQAIGNPGKYAGFVEEAMPLSSVWKGWNGPGFGSGSDVRLNTL